MPVDVTTVGSRLQLRLQTGFDEDGDPILRTRTFSRIKPDADNDDLFMVAQEFIGLQENDAHAIRRVDEVELEES